MRVSRLCKILVARHGVCRESRHSAMPPVAPDAKNCVKRFKPFLHYPNKWKTSRCGAMSHGLGPQPGNPRLGSSRVPEPTGKRLRRFLPGFSSAVFVSAVFFRGADRFVWPK